MSAGPAGTSAAAGPVSTAGRRPLMRMLCSSAKHNSGKLRHQCRLFLQVVGRRRNHCAIEITSASTYHRPMSEVLEFTRLIFGS